MTIQSNCVGCGQTLAVADEYAGRKARCPNCGSIYTVPERTALTTEPIDVPSEDYKFSSNPYAIERPADAGSSVSSSDTGSPAQYWIQDAQRKEYGPVDRATLQQWFAEGRIGQAYSIRASDGPWQPAELYGSVSSSSGGSGIAVIVVMAALGFVCCPIFPIIGIVLANVQLQAIREGRQPESTKTGVLVGLYLNIGSLVLAILSTLFMLVPFAFMR